MRWMYPFERYMKVLKGYVKSRSRPEGCIAERYMSKKLLSFVPTIYPMLNVLQECQILVTLEVSMAKGLMELK